MRLHPDIHSRHAGQSYTEGMFAQLDCDRQHRRDPQPLWAMTEPGDPLTAADYEAFASLGRTDTDLPAHTCLGCGKEFTPRGVQNYCTPDCRYQTLHKPRQPGPDLSHVTPEEWRTMSDRRIALKYGLQSTSYPRYWRQRHGIPGSEASTANRSFDLSGADWTKTDTENAAIHGCTTPTVCQWRKKHGIPASRPPGQPSRLKTITLQEWAAMTDAMIAVALNCRPGSVYQYRRKHNLPKPHP